MESISRFELSFHSSRLELRINRQEDSASVLAVESSKPELEPDELPADKFPLLLLTSPVVVPEIAVDDEDAVGQAGGAMDVDGFDMVFGILEGCVSHRSASCVNN